MSAPTFKIADLHGCIINFVGSFTGERSFVLNEVTDYSAPSDHRFYVTQFNTDLHEIRSIFISANNVVMHCFTAKKVP
jgi:hypothetical protein